jgi:hypothetical protein
MPWLFFLAIPRDKDMLATFVHALAFQGHVGNVRSCLGLFSLQFPATRTSWQRSFMPWLFFLAIPRDKDMLATFVHALGIFSHLFFPNLLRSLEKGK